MFIGWTLMPYKHAGVIYLVSIIIKSKLQSPKLINIIMTLNNDKWSQNINTYFPKND